MLVLPKVKLQFRVNIKITVNPRFKTKAKVNSKARFKTKAKPSPIIGDREKAGLGEAGDKVQFMPWSVLACQTSAAGVSVPKNAGTV